MNTFSLLCFALLIWSLFGLVWIAVGVATAVWVDRVFRRTENPNGPPHELVTLFWPLAWIGLAIATLVYVVSLISTAAIERFNR